MLDSLTLRFGLPVHGSGLSTTPFSGTRIWEAGGGVSSGALFKDLSCSAKGTQSSGFVKQDGGLQAPDFC